METKVKSHGDKVTYFFNKKIPKVDSKHTSLEVISLDSTIKNDDGNNHCQCF